MRAKDYDSGCDSDGEYKEKRDHAIDARRSLARSALRKAWESICRSSMDPVYRADGLGRHCSEEDKSPAAVSKE
jgi:hypothetical protein